MKLVELRLSGFQCFGKTATTIGFDNMTYMLGPNGSGKTAVLQALSRLFAFNPALRRIQRSDFHMLEEGTPIPDGDPPILWIEADFEFPEAKAKDGTHSAIPAFFAHMQMESADGVPRVRFRLTARIDADGDIEEKLIAVISVKADGSPDKEVAVQKVDRTKIHVHYLPARRDPIEHVSFAASTLLGRLLRSADWKDAREAVTKLTEAISSELETNKAIQHLDETLVQQWASLYVGKYFRDPSVSFERNEIESLLRHLTIKFSPGHGIDDVDFSRLSDGQQSLLYVALVLTNQVIGRGILAGTDVSFDVVRLRPPVFTLIAMEEPENSLSPHFLGRVVKALTDFSGESDAQAVVATHAPSILRRVPPESIRYLRLDANRSATVATIQMPPDGDEANKFVREAVQAFPELYFSRLVILGEGDSEEIVLPRLILASGLSVDQASISVAPLGGRHVNHFWRLLQGLGIPHVTLLDLDMSRNQAGWGRLRYAASQLLKFSAVPVTLKQENIDGIPEWNSDRNVIDDEKGKEWIDYLETANVFYSSPLDLDFAMLEAFPDAYGIQEGERTKPDEDLVKSVLGKSNAGVEQYYDEEAELFGAYHRLFKLGSKPAAHLKALAELTDAELNAKMPEPLKRLLAKVKVILEAAPE